MLSKIVSIYFAVLFSISNFICYAEEFSFFKFKMPSYFISSSAPIELNFIYNLDGYNEGEFKVIPVTGNNILELFNSNINMWVPENSQAFLYPALNEKYFVRFHNGKLLSTTLYFKILNINTGVEYTTSTKKVWGTLYLKSFTDILNNNLQNYSLNVKIHQ